MHLKLSDFANRLSTASITLPSGKAHDLRALTVAEERAVERHLPRPTPPMKKDPNKGSLSQIPDETNPAYQAEFDAWYERVSVMRLAVALGYRPNGQTGFRETPESHQQRWLNLAHDELVAEVSMAWLRDAVKALQGLSLGRALEEAGPGNSGTSPASSQSSPPRSKRGSKASATPSAASPDEGSSSSASSEATPG